MDIKSLMIGDWVYDTLSQTNIKVNRGFFEISPLNGICYAENLIPIPLTAKILEKNGVKWLCSEPSGRKTYCCNEPWISCTYFPYSGWLVCVGATGSIKKTYVEVSTVQYVHQLQHALRLCGISKEIEL